MRTSGRVVLVAGQGGAGATSLARTTADAVRAEGFTVLEVDASGATVARPDASVVSLTGATFGRLWQEAGADPVVPEAWSGLPDVGLVDAWIRITQARQQSDVVVVDAGPLARVRDLCVLPGTLAHLLDAAMTPRMAMWRSVSGAGGLFESLSDLRMGVRAWLDVLQHDATSVRLVARPERDCVDEVLGSSAVLSMLGVDVDGIVVNRVPRKGAGGTDGHAARAEGRATVAALTEGSDGVPVWRATSRPDARPSVRPVPKGSSPVALLTDAAVPATRARSMGLSADDDGYRLAIPLRGEARRRARVGVQDDRLVVSLDGVHAWHELPSLLRRCEPLGAARTATGVTIRWSPDAGVWPHRPAAERVVGEEG